MGNDKIYGGITEALMGNAITQQARECRCDDHNDSLKRSNPGATKTIAFHFLCLEQFAGTERRKRRAQTKRRAFQIT